MAKSLINQKIQVHSCGKDMGYADATHIIDDPVIEPQDGQLRVRNHFAGINGLFDRMAIKGAIGYMPLTAPFDLGVEAVGLVEAVGNGSEFAVGDAVATTGFGGGYRHRQIVDANKVYLIPQATPKYMAIVPTGISALVALEQVAQLQTGETVVVSAAAGGLGHIWIQLAVNLGCRVIGIAGSDSKCAFVESLGAEHCINYKQQSIHKVLNTDYQDAIDVAVDTVGGELFDAMLNNIAPLGRLLVSGYACEILDGAKPQLQARVYEKLYWKGASIRGFMNALLPEYHRDAAYRLFEMMHAEQLKISIDPTAFLGLGALQSAAEHMLSGRNIGKTVLDLRSS